MKPTILIEAGHGGMIEGKYTTAPAKMHTFDDGYTFYEGVFNRLLCKEILKQAEGKPYDVVYCNTFYSDDEGHDAPLSVRSKVINRLNKVYGGKCIGVSVHGNAGGGYGGEVFHYPNSTKSEALAGCFSGGWSDNTRRKNRGVKTANFHMLRETAIPMILTENGFFDNRSDAEYMKSQNGLEEMAAAHVQAFDNYIKNYLI